MFQTKEQNKNTEKKTLNDIKVSRLPDKEFKVMTIQMFTKLRSPMDE